MSPLTKHNQVDLPTAEPISSPRPNLTLADLPAHDAQVTLTSGRRVELSAREEGDHLTVRSPQGNVVLHVVMTDRGPVLSFEAADIALSATRQLTLTAESIAVNAQRDLTMTVEGNMTQTVTGTRHTRVTGAERLEAAAVEIQANEANVAVRAAGHIALDGAHIGLNDDPCPTPFEWSAIAEDRSEQETEG
ncbi:MAG: hypothetical protein IPK82_11450 [Polyangiaceae bacterium]|nr:hypothetical protein [Polyangiaceae bacterium]